MEKRLLFLLRLVLVGVCLAHLGLGIGLNVWPDLPKMAAAWYGVTKEFDWSAQFLYILKPIGAYMITMGILVAIAVVNPRKYAAIVYGVGILLILRGVQRIVFQQEIIDAFEIQPLRNMINAAFFGGFGIVLILLRFLAGLASEAKQ
jgi:hypothetical protein